MERRQDVIGNAFTHNGLDHWKVMISSDEVRSEILISHRLYRQGNKIASIFNFRLSTI